MSVLFDSPAEVYDIYQNAAPDNWLRVAVRLRKAGTAEEFSVAHEDGVYVWDSGEVKAQYLRVRGNDAKYRLHTFFFDDLDGPSWTDGLLVVDADGNRSTTLIDGVEGVSEDFLELGKDFVQEYLAEHREEMTQLGRHTYGGRRRRLFRR